MTAFLFDVETTGTDEGAEIIEAATAPLGLSPEGEPYIDGVITVRRFKPEGPILPGAMAAHHIIAEDLRDEPPSSMFRLPEGTEYIVGHRIDFDWEMAGKPDVKRICTLAMARKLWPTRDAHTLSALLYSTLQPEIARRRLVGAHSAYVDVENTLTILHAICGAVQVDTFEGLWRFSEEARIPEVIAFGKHKGTRVEDLPLDYREWMLRQDDMDPYVLIAVRRSMGIAGPNDG